MLNAQRTIQKLGFISRGSAQAVEALRYEFWHIQNYNRVGHGANKTTSERQDTAPFSDLTAPRVGRRFQRGRLRVKWSIHIANDARAVEDLECALTRKRTSRGVGMVVLLQYRADTIAARLCLQSNACCACSDIRRAGLALSRTRRRRLPSVSHDIALIMGLKNQISTYSDTNAALEQHIMAMRLKILEQLTESSPGPLSASDVRSATSPGGDGK